MTTPSYDATPPISAPLRFFLTAPVFGLLLGVLLLGIDPDALLSRWSWPVLAGTHLLTLGMLAPVMVGALIQMLPVVAAYKRVVSAADMAKYCKVPPLRSMDTFVQDVPWLLLR